MAWLIQASKTTYEQLRSLNATRNDCFLDSSMAKNRLKAAKKEKYWLIKVKNCLKELKYTWHS
jgi:hypothetical protein